jgi:hypothetical protein
MARSLLKLALIVFAGVFVLVWLSDLSRHDSAPSQNTAPHPQSFARRLDVKVVQDQLLRMGFDVQVSVIQEDDSRMIIYGKSVNRPFAYNLMARRDFKKMLHDGKFTEVTFMDSMSFPDFVQTYAVK